MSTTLQQIWDELVQVGYNVRSAKEDGLNAWQPYKETYSEYSVQDYPEGIELRQEFKDLVNNLEYKFKNTVAIDHFDVLLTINGEILDNKKETDHFIIQHFRIPKMLNFKLPIVKFAQLAYNVGQARSVMKNGNVYSNNVVKFYQQNNLDNITTYITEKMAKETVYPKYVKHKTKYLALKKK